MDCFVAFGATRSVPFQSDSMFPYLKAFSDAEDWMPWTGAALLQVGEQWPQGLPTCQQDILWAPGFLLLSFSNQTK